MKKISLLMSNLAPKEGFNITSINSVKIYKISEYQAPEPLCYEKGIIIAGQGSKRVCIGNNCFEYNPENYLVLGVPLPAKAETFASRETPFLALVIDFNSRVLNRIFEKMEPYMEKYPDDFHNNQLGIFTAQSSSKTKDATIRLLEVLQSPMESCILGKNMVDELFFRILCSKNASILYALSVKDSNHAKIEKALSIIYQDFTKPFNIDELSSSVNMSSSGFHRTFKSVTGYSPIQYLKKLRLDRARDMLLTKGSRVYEAADHVGYSSSAQFSREFKRYFGSSPADYVASRRINYNVEKK